MKGLITRGQQVPYFIAKLIGVTQIEEIIKPLLVETDIFVVQVLVLPGNIIQVFIDRKVGGVTLEDCTMISKAINNSFDREVEDFELEVSSPGIKQGLKVIEQYYKNIGREIEVKKTDGIKIEGVLKEVTPIEISLLETKKAKIEGKKKKEKTEIVHKLSFDEIKEAKPIIKFN